MNIMEVSEKHGLLIIAIGAKLFVFELNPLSMTITNPTILKKISLDNENNKINNMKMIECDGRQFLVTVDDGGYVRMLFLDDLLKDPIKFHNVYPGHDNSTWSLCGSTVNPPRVAVGSNSHKISVFNLSTGLKQTIHAHGHNVPCVSFSPCGKFIASTSIDKTLKIWEETANGSFQLARMCIPSNDWGWAVQWLDKRKCDIIYEEQELLELSQSKSENNSNSSLQKRTNETTAGQTGLRTYDVFHQIQELHSLRTRIFSQISAHQTYNDELLEESPAIGVSGENQTLQPNHGEDSEELDSEMEIGEREDEKEVEEEEAKSNEKTPLITEIPQSSGEAMDMPVELGSEETNEQILGKYLLFHCAKLELSLIDASSGRYLANQSLASLQKYLRKEDMMNTIMKQNVQNQMYFEELTLSQVFQMRNYSRYLFLEFIEAFSLIMVGNQGSYDLHLFKLTNVVDSTGGNKFLLSREYVYKGNDQNARIVGVSVVKNIDSARIYILTEDKKLNCLEIRRRIKDFEVRKNRRSQKKQCVKPRQRMININSLYF